MDIEQPYSKRPEWEDVKPIHHSEDEKSIVNIAYSEKFAEVFAYFRAILEANEQSERALALTKDAAILNPANYTVWHFRRILLKTLKKDPKEELRFCNEVIEENPKNYQVWHHRQVLVDWSGEPCDELAFTAEILRDDAKNYHAWQHRQWAVSRFSLWADELDFSAGLLSEDLRNNSAWNYRYFVITSTTGFTPDVLEREVRTTLELIRKAPHNESAWNYLQGILMDSAGISAYPGVWEFCAQLYGENHSRAPHLLTFMIDSLSERAERSTDREKKAADVAEACKLCDELVTVDPIRKEYWRHLKRKLELRNKESTA